MITKRDALKIGSAICDAVRRETAYIERCERPYNVTAHARGVGLYAMESLFYDVLPDSTRAQFDYKKDEFFIACGWP